LAVEEGEVQRITRQVEALDLDYATSRSARFVLPAGKDAFAQTGCLREWDRVQES
jgi:hypothetical protein